MTLHFIRANTHTNTHGHIYMPIYLYVTMIKEYIESKCNG